MKRNPSMKQAEWIAKRIAPILGKHTADDVFDVLTGQITNPADFVSEVIYQAEAYEEELRSHNVRR